MDQHYSLAYSTTLVTYSSRIVANMSHPLSSHNNSLGFTGGKHYQKIIIAIFRLVLQNFAIPGYFPYIIFYGSLFALHSSGWFVIEVCCSILVREVVKH